MAQNIEVTIKEESEGKWMTYAKADFRGSNMDRELSNESSSGMSRWQKHHKNNDIIFRRKSDI